MAKRLIRSSDYGVTDGVSWLKLPKGTLIHVNGIPAYVERRLRVLTSRGNVRLIADFISKSAPGQEET